MKANVENISASYTGVSVESVESISQPKVSRILSI